MGTRPPRVLNKVHARLAPVSGMGYLRDHLLPIVFRMLVPCHYLHLLDGGLITLR